MGRERGVPGGHTDERTSEQQQRFKRSKFEILSAHDSSANHSSTKSPKLTLSQRRDVEMGPIETDTDWYRTMADDDRMTSRPRRIVIGGKKTTTEENTKGRRVVQHRRMTLNNRGDDDQKSESERRRRRRRQRREHKRAVWKGSLFRQNEPAAH